MECHSATSDSEDAGDVAMVDVATLEADTIPMAESLAVQTLLS